jgi:hypothetical protein
MSIAGAKKNAITEKIKINRKTVTVERIAYALASASVERSLLRGTPSLAPGEFVASLRRVLDELCDEANMQALLFP